MAHNDKPSALDLHIEVNKQNLSFSEKNVRTLRLPTNPSWPKIPRRLTNSANNIIEPPCVITLMGTCTKTCNTMRAITCQHSKPKCEAVTQMPKRLSGCLDPRFRRQILQQKTKKPNEFFNMDNNEQKTQLDRCILQKIKKVEKDLQENLVSESADDSSYHDMNKLLKSVTKSKRSTDCFVKKGSTLEANYSSLCMATERDDNIHRSFQEQKQDVEIAYQSDDVEDQEIVGNISTTSTLTSKSMSTFKNLANKKHLPNGMRQYDIKNDNDISENKIISCCDKHVSDCIHNKENINLNVSLNQETRNEISANKSHQNFNIIDNINDAKSDKNILNRNIPEILRTAVERGNIDSYIVTDDHISDIKRERWSEKIVVASSVRPCTNIWKEIVKNKRLIMDKLPLSMKNDKMLYKCIQTFILSEVRGKKYKKNNDENKENHRESYINYKRKMTLLNLLRKAESFFWKKSRLMIADFDCVLILPDPCRIKGIQSNLTKHTTFCSLRSLQAENIFEKLSPISLESETQLNKNYWKYYIKPKRKIAITKSDTVGKKNKRQKLRNYSFGSRTLQRYSLLSCIINTVLQDLVAISGKSSSNPTMNGMPNVHEDICNTFELLPTFVKKINQARKQLFGLKTIALLSIMMYVAVIFLPMMYDNFSDEECDDYENENYIEITSQYIESSFRQVFNEIIDVLNTILLSIIKLT